MLKTIGDARGSERGDGGASVSPARAVEYALEVEGVRKHYGKFEAVKDVSFKVRKGTCFGILGPNGAGKTSLLAMIEGLTPITAGKITVLGMDAATRMGEIQAHVGAQLQSNRYFEFLTVSELLNFYSELRAAVSAKKACKPIDELLDNLGLRDKLDSKVAQLSGGQKQRLSIAIALLEDPDIIYLDEPTTALDAQSRNYIWEFVERLKQERKKTIILTTHYMEEAERLCDEIMIMNGGKIIAQGEPSAMIKTLDADYAFTIEFGKGQFKPEFLAGMRNSSAHVWNGTTDTLTARAVDIALALDEVIGIGRERGIRIVNIDIVRPTLEDVFLTHTGKELRE